MLKPEAIGTTDALKALKMGEGMTPGEFFKTFDENRQLLPKFNQELSKDLEDTVDFYRLSFRQLRVGETKSSIGGQTFKQKTSIDGRTFGKRNAGKR